MYDHLEVGYSDQPDLPAPAVDLNEGIDWIIPKYITSGTDHRLPTPEEEAVMKAQLAIREQLMP
jgi:hypothetical protein